MYIYLQMIESLEDEQKFKHIFKTYSKRMHYEAYRILKNKHDTEDAVFESIQSGRVIYARDEKRWFYCLCRKKKHIEKLLAQRINVFSVRIC